MSYKFVVGRSGSGKTNYVLEELIKSSLENKDILHIIIVPEQYTMQIQKEVVRLHPKHATTNIDILSFNRLAIKIFKELNINLPNILDDIAKAIIIKKVANDNKKDLYLWKDKFSKYGFLDKFKSLISELYQYNIKASQIRKVIEDNTTEKTKLLENKLGEIDLLYNAFSEYIKGKHIVSEEVLDILAKNLRKSKKLKGAYLVFDSFTGFTPIQYKLVEILMDIAYKSTFTLCADSADIDRLKLAEDDLFYMTMAMSKHINNLADKNMIRQEESIYLENSYIRSESLKHLEEYFLREKKFKRIEVNEDIEIVSTNNLEDEVNFVVNKINNLVKRKNYRYRDIAIISGDLSRYADKLASKLGEEDIPYHIDANIQISTNTFVEFINILLELITNNYNYDSIMRYIRNPFAYKDIKDYELYSLDNYMYITGSYSYKKISKPFKYIPKKYKGIAIEKLNEIRENILKQTEKLYLLLNPKKDNKNTDIEINISNIIEELKNIFNSLDVEEKLLAISEDFKKNADEQRTREYGEVYESVIDLFNTLENLLDGEKLKKKEFIDLFRAGLSQVEIGLIPSVLDSIFIGDIIRSRGSRTKAVFILGMNEGIIPNTGSRYSLISDREKEFLEQKYKLKLSQTLKQSIYEQKYYLYLAMTKASEKLYLSYSNTDADMKAIRPAGILKNIKELYTDLSIKKFEKIDKISSLRELKEEIFSASNLMLDDKTLRDSLKILLDTKTMLKLDKMMNFEYEEENIGKELANKLFGEILKLSVSRLEKYAACPYRHFVEYGLRLDERKKYTIGSVDIGNLVHTSLEKIFKDYIAYNKEKEGNIEAFLKNLDTKVEITVNEILEAEEENKYTEDAKSIYIKQRVLSLLKLNLDILFYQLSKGKFEPDEMEFSFDIKDDALYDIKLDNDKKMYISGKVDRIDIYDSSKDNLEIEGENANRDYLALKIIDYKTGSTKWDTDLVKYGLQLQLAFYLDICMKIYKEKYKKDIEPAAIVYAGLVDKFIDRSSFESLCKAKEVELGRDLKEEEKINLSKELLYGEYKMDGLINKSAKIIKALDNDLYNINMDGMESTIIDKLSTKAEFEDENSKDKIKTWNLSLGKGKSENKNVIEKDKIHEILVEAGEKIRELGKGISSGDIKVAPVLVKDKGLKFSCEYCEYKSICGFDKKIKGYEYKKVGKKESRKEVEE